MLKKQSQGLWKSRGKMEVVLGKVGHDEAIGEEGLLDKFKRIDYSVTCRSCLGHVWLFRIDDLLIYLPILAVTWRKMIDQKQANRVLSFQKGFWVVWAKTEGTTTRSGTLEPMRPNLTFVKQASPRDFVSNSLRRNPTFSTTFHKLTALKNLHRPKNQSVEQIIDEATLFLGSTPCRGRLEPTRGIQNRMSNTSSTIFPDTSTICLKTILSKKNRFGISGAVFKNEREKDPGLTFKRLSYTARDT